VFRMLFRLPVAHATQVKTTPKPALHPTHFEEGVDFPNH